ncbi:MAG: glycosyltransferase family 2 protein [Candidatus Bathyarchaeia archaeon]|jgi:dolichol-phosphate mannosyltransferase
MLTETQLKQSQTKANYEVSRTGLEYGIPGLAVIIPALNEAAGIFRTLLELKLELQEFGGKSTYLVVDGHSNDDTGRIAHRLGAVVLEQERVGKGDAFRQALSHVPENAKYVVLMDADFTYPAEHIPEMISLMESDPSIGMVSGNRFGKNESRELFKRSFYVGNRILALVQAVANSVLMHDPLSGLRVVKCDLLKDWTPKAVGFDIEVELNHHIVKCGYSIREIPIGYRIRVGEKKLRRRDGLTILHRMLTQTPLMNFLRVIRSS